MIILHVFLLTIVTITQLIVTQTYLNDKQDMDELVKAFNKNATELDWTKAENKAVLTSAFSEYADSMKNDAVEQLDLYIHFICLPLWKTVYEQQLIFRALLAVFTGFYGLYALRWMYFALRLKKTVDDTVGSYDKMIETSMWFITQIVEVVFIAYGFLAFYNMYTNSITPELYNDGRERLTLTTSLSAPDAKTTMTERCFAMDRVLGHDLWGKHTPWIHDKLMMDIILMVTVSVLVVFRYAFTANKLYGNDNGKPIPYAGGSLPPSAMGYPPMYNVVALR